MTRQNGPLYTRHRSKKKAEEAARGWRNAGYEVTVSKSTEQKSYPYRVYRYRK